MIPLTPTDLATARIAGVANGCGPKRWRRHTWRWWIARLLMPGLELYCEVHDVRYWFGGTDLGRDDDDRGLADAELRDLILAHAARSGRLGRWLLRDEAPVVYDGVREEGATHFHHAKPARSLADLYALAAISGGEAA